MFRLLAEIQTASNLFASRVRLISARVAVAEHANSNFLRALALINWDSDAAFYRKFEEVTDRWREELRVHVAQIDSLQDVYTEIYRFTETLQKPSEVPLPRDQRKRIHFVLRELKRFADGRLASVESRVSYTACQLNAHLGRDECIGHHCPMFEAFCMGKCNGAVGVTVGAEHQQLKN